MRFFLSVVLFKAQKTDQIMQMEENMSLCTSISSVLISVIHYLIRPSIQIKNCHVFEKKAY